MLKLHSYNDYQEVVKNILQPLETYCNSNISSIKLPKLYFTNYSQNELNFETFSRTLLGAIIANNKPSTNAIFMKMIKKGIDPKSSQYWGIISNYDQTLVEMYPILLYLIKMKDEISTCFSKNNLHDLEQWFLQINNVAICNNNWHFFPILVNLFLHKLNLKYDQEIINNSWEKIDEMYLGNGWYKDGDSKQKDYYISFAFHFYSLLYAYYSNDKKRKEIIINRANIFAKSYIHFFSSTGESTPFGRSLTYKFAHVAFWSMYALFIKDKQQLGIIKGIINRNIRWWLSKDIFDHNGLLVNGYTYENPYMLEQYNGTGSPYWAFKAFFCMLEPNSDYFKVEELPYPKISTTKHIQEANICIYHYNGHSFAFINGQQNPYFCNKTAKYEKFVYSSLFGFNISRSYETLEMLAPDNTLAIKIGDNIVIRNNATIIHNDEKVQISDWTPIPSITIRSFIFIGAPWHIRVHYVISTINFSLYDFAFAINADDNQLQKNISNNEICIIGKNSCSGIKGTKGNANYIKCVPSTNILYPQNLIPYIHYNISPGNNIYITSVYGDITKGEFDIKPTIKNAIKVKKKNLIAFGKSYQLPKTAIKQKLSIINNIIYTKLSYLTKYISSKQ